MKRCFISHLDTAPAQPCMRVFRCFGYEVYGTLQDTDESLPAPVEAARIVASPDRDFEDFRQGILSCSVVIYDMLAPADAVRAFEICAHSQNQRKMICISTFMTWARTQAPDDAEIEPLEEENEINEDDLPDEREMEPAEVIQLYQKAKRTPPKWVVAKLAAQKRAEAAEAADEEPEEEAEEDKNEAENGQNDAEQDAQQAEAEEAAEDEEEDENPQNRLPVFNNTEFPPYNNQIPVQSVAQHISEANFAQRRPHPDFREHFAAENQIVALLYNSENLSGAILVPGIVYGYGETVLAQIFRLIYEFKMTQFPLFYGGHGRSLPFTHALDLALLAHAIVHDAQPDKASPFVFAAERQQVTARAFAEACGGKLLLDDPRREAICQTIRHAELMRPPRPLTKQTFRLWQARKSAPQLLPKYVKEFGKEETLRCEFARNELLADVCLGLGFAHNEILDAKWPLFATGGVLSNIELSFSEYQAAWGIYPVRMLLQTPPDCKIDFAREVACYLARVLQIDPRDDDRMRTEVLRSLAEEVGRQRSEQTDEEFYRIEEDVSSVRIVDCSLYDAKSIQQLNEKIVLDRHVRTRGYILINIPEQTDVQQIFGKPAVADQYEYYAAVGLVKPKARKHADEEEPEEENADEDKPEWLTEPDVQIDDEEKTQRIRERILLPYTAPVRFFTAGRSGLEKLAEEAPNRLHFYDANICLEHPDGFRVPYPDYVVQLNKILRYEQQPEETYVRQWKACEQMAMQLYRTRMFYQLREARKSWVLSVKNQLIKEINRNAEKSGEGEYDDESYNWLENYSLQGLDPRVDLQYFRIPKREGLPEEPEEPEEEPAEEGQEPRKREPKPINPADYDLGIENEEVYVVRRQQQAERRAARRQRNLARKERERNGDESVSDQEEEHSEPQIDEATGKEVRMQPKMRPFLNAPWVPKKVEDVKQLQDHFDGFAFQLFETLKDLNTAQFKFLNLLGHAHFAEAAVEAAQFVGPSRGFGRTRVERIEKAERERLEAEIKRRIEEEDAMRRAEAKRIAEELRIHELKELRDRLVKLEEKRVVELSVPLRKYLSVNVMGELIDGLIEVSRLRPSDPVRYLGEYLIDKSVSEIK